MRLIDWDKVLEWMHRQKETMEQWSMRIAIENYVDEMPTIDAVEVVRCKDCVWFKTNHTWSGREYKVCVREAYEPMREDEDYCSGGRRREDADE